jgi:hypothetical protein
VIHEIGVECVISRFHLENGHAGGRHAYMFCLSIEIQKSGGDSTSSLALEEVVRRYLLRRHRCLRAFSPIEGSRITDLTSNIHWLVLSVYCRTCRFPSRHIVGLTTNEPKVDWISWV